MNALTLAQAMNVTEKDVTRLLNMVVTSMTQDGFAEIFIDMSEFDRADAVNAYIQSEVKKFSEFCVTLMTNQEKKSAFDQYIYSQLSA